MVQNTKALSYCSIILPLCSTVISFTLHNIPIVYKIFSITELQSLNGFDMLSVLQIYYMEYKTIT